MWKFESGANEMKLFGTDGIRTRAGVFPLNASAILAIGQAIGEELSGPILVGEDTRVSSPWILGLLIEGIRRSEKSHAESAGVIPTPAVALLTRSHSFAGGIMISASHNPFEDNGIKVFSHDGTKLTDEVEKQIEDRIAQLLPAGAEAITDSVPDSNPAASMRSSWLRRYEEMLVSHFATGRWLSGKRIVVDCANGAMSLVAPELLRTLGAEVRAVSVTPTGRNINSNCGAVHPEALVLAMKADAADLGVAFDGDGDRSVFVSQSGKLVDGDAVLLVMSRRMKPSRIVGTSMTNYALEKKLESEGVGLTRVAVGDRYVFEEMQRSGAPLGGEPSGHIIFSDFRLSGDGLLTTLKLAQAMVEAGQSLDDLTRDWIPAPQLLKGVRVSERVPLETMNRLQTAMRETNAVLNGCGRLVVRYSGTEPLLRVMIESDDARRNEEWMKKILRAIEEDFENLR
jgi:phosphoglucosamine mutase